jgi:hypothetical protein
MFFGPFSSKPPPHLDDTTTPLTAVPGLHCYLPDASPYCPSSVQGTFFSTVGMMPRLKSAVNYKNDILINNILEILPNCEYGWQAVSFAYHEQSKEKDPRNTDTLKRH